MSVRQTEAFFGVDGPMRGDGGGRGDFRYEPRPQQLAMAQAVASALADGENLCVEAPTGVGKTFAYLVPAYYHALETSRPVIVSTHTISLQEQIVTRDVPLLNSFLGQEVRAVVAKGRRNYLCLRRLNQIAEWGQQALPGDILTGEDMKFVRWCERTRTGDLSEVSFPVSSEFLGMVCCEVGNCLNKECEFYKKCYLMRARREMHDAQIIVTNHAMLFAVLAMEERKARARQRNGGAAEKEAERIFPEYSAVVMDEAHTLEDCASNHFGLRVDSGRLRWLLNRLYSDERKSGLLMAANEIAACRTVNACRQKLRWFFDSLRDWLRPQQRNPLRYTVPNHIRNYAGEDMKWLCQEIREVAGHATEVLQAELATVVEALEEASADMDHFFAMDLGDYVHWFELGGRDGQELSMNAAPVNVAPPLSRNLFSRKPVILTSATLAVAGSIDYFQRRVGVEDARTLILDSPFDYEKQVVMYMARDMPDPRDTDLFQARASASIAEFLKRTDGHAFVLFTSYAMMNAVGERMEDFFVKEEMTLMIQGSGLSPRKMLEKFRKSDKAVIFGTASFWTGVDVPGDALNNVIITRLPFAVPNHPLQEARTEMVEQNGGRAFFDYSLPEAVLKFRQGFGRLIRTKEDKGIVVVLDSRIISKPYGQSFLQSVPSCPVELF